jgi:hypothetical protein
MRKRIVTITWIATLAAIPSLPVLVHAQMPSPQSPTAKNNVSAPADPHDLSGMWEFFANIPG